MPGVKMPVTDDQRLSLAKRAHELCRRADFQNGSLFDPDLALDVLQWLIEGGYNQVPILVDHGTWKDVAREQIEIILMVARERRYYRNRFGKIFDFRPFWMTLQTVGLDVIKQAQKLGLEFHYFPIIDCAIPYGIIGIDSWWRLNAEVVPGQLIRRSGQHPRTGEIDETYYSFFNLCDDWKCNEPGKTALVDMRPRANGVRVFPDDNLVMPEIEKLVQEDLLLDYGNFRDGVSKHGSGLSLWPRCGLTSLEWELRLAQALHSFLATRLLDKVTLRWTLRLERYVEAWLIPSIYADSPRAGELKWPIQVWLEEYCRDSNGGLSRLVACSMDENEVLQVLREPLDQRRENLALRPIIVFEN